MFLICILQSRFNLRKRSMVYNSYEGYNDSDLSGQFSNKRECVLNDCEVCIMFISHLFYYYGCLIPSFGLLWTPFCNLISWFKLYI